MVYKVDKDCSVETVAGYHDLHQLFVPITGLSKHWHHPLNPDKAVQAMKSNNCINGYLVAHES